jgi:hypothetical protein
MRILFILGVGKVKQNFTGWALSKLIKLSSNLYTLSLVDAIKFMEK